MQTRRTTGRLIAATVAGTLAIAGLGACGSSGSTVSKKTTTSAVATTTAGSAAVPSKVNTAACNAWLKTDSIVQKGPETSGPESEPNPQQLQAFAKSLQPSLSSFADSAPTAVAASVTSVTAIVTDASQGKNLADFDPTGPKLATPLSKIEAWVHDSCGFTSIDVMGEDFSFAGLDGPFKAGPTSIEFQNMSKVENHEATLLKLNPGAPITAKDLAAAIKADPEGAESKYGQDVTPSGGVVAAPGQTVYTTSDLVAGDYVAICMIPQGGKDGGTPHAKLGMVTAFTVE